MIIKEQHYYEISNENDDFEEKDLLNLPPIGLRNSEEMEKYIRKMYPDSDIRKLFDAGQLFIFRIGLDQF